MTDLSRVEKCSLCRKPYIDIWQTPTNHENAKEVCLACLGQLSTICPLEINGSRVFAKGLTDLTTVPLFHDKEVFNKNIRELDTEDPNIRKQMTYESIQRSSEMMDHLVKWFFDVFYPAIESASPTIRNHYKMELLAMGRDISRDLGIKIPDDKETLAKIIAFFIMWDKGDDDPTEPEPEFPKIGDLVG